MAFSLRGGRGQSGDLRLHRITHGVWLFRGFFSNSAVLDLGPSLLVVDTQVTPTGGERLRRAIRQVSDKPITHVVNTHYHGDHAGGNAAFAGAEIIATEETARYIAERDGERLDYCNAFGLETQDVPEVAPPTRTFGARLDLTVGEERIEIFQAGRVETPDACVVWWPRRRVLCAGDGVATVSYPFLGVPFLDEGLRPDGEWVRFLRHLARLQPDYILGGHGEPLVGRVRCLRRLALLERLFIDLFEAVRTEMSLGTPLPLLVDKVQDRLGEYRAHPDLEENTVSQRFAILRAYHGLRPERRGKGWWHDLRPSVIVRAPADEAARVAARLDAAGVRDFARRRARRARPLVLAVLERWVAEHPYDAAAHGHLADVLFDGAAGVSPAVDATEYLGASSRAARAALALDPTEPLALLNLGCLQIFSAMVLQQSMVPGMDKVTAALSRGALSPRHRRKANFFLGKAHQFDLRDDEADRFFAAVLPGPLRFLFPLVRPILRRTP